MVFKISAKRPNGYILSVSKCQRLPKWQTRATRYSYNISKFTCLWGEYMLWNFARIPEIEG